MLVNPINIQTWALYFAFLFASFLLSFGVIHFFLDLAPKVNLLDLPNDRSSHSVPTPRGGGVGILIAFIALFPVINLTILPGGRTSWVFYFSSIAISILGFIDDLVTLSRRNRMIAWFVIGLVPALSGISLQEIVLPFLGKIQFGIFSPLVTLLWLIGLTNLYNFMDGINGLAGFEALIVSCFLALVAYLSGNILVFLLSSFIAGAALGFLPYNFPAAKVFLGDVGSNFLGYVFAFLAVLGSQDPEGTIPFLIPVILLMMFLLDAGTTLLRRLPKGKDWLEPHRDHIYQRLVILGFTHTQVTLVYALSSCVLGAVALCVYASWGWREGVLAVSSILPFLIILFFTRQMEKKVR